MAVPLAVNYHGYLMNEKEKEMHLDLRPMHLATERP